MPRKQAKHKYLNLEDLPNIPWATAQFYRYEGLWRSSGVCGLQYGQLPDGRNFIVLTELPQNEGTSITNMIEKLATWVITMLGYDPTDTVFIEHYPDSYNQGWSLVQPEWDGKVAKVPNGNDRWMWKYLSPGDAMSLLGIVEVTS